MNDKFVSPEPRPEPYQAEALEVLVEEAAEVIIELAMAQQRATKILRFGVHEVQTGHLHSNMQRLSQELGDLSVATEYLMACGLVDKAHFEHGCARKRLKLRKYLQTNPSANSPG